MNKTKYDNILNYAGKIKEAYPNITNDDLKKALEAYFIGGKDIFNFSNKGAVINPLVGYISIFSILYNSIKKVITQDRTKLNKIQDDIDRAIEHLTHIT